MKRGYCVECRKEVLCESHDDDHTVLTVSGGVPA